MIKLVVFDFDGVFTNGKCHIDADKISKYYDVKDGMGISLLKSKNILTGLISSYTNDIIVEWNNDSVYNNIHDHLKFDLISLGKKNKLEILNEWMISLNISYQNVAYIGDDIMDIPLLELVGFSACPSDAVDECKNIVNYVCNKKGGELCVREFIDIILQRDYPKYNKIIDEIKHEALYQLNHYNIEDIIKISDIIRSGNIEHNIYCSGVGKSEIIASYLCNLLKSIGIKCFILNAMNALHGDVGTIKNRDVIIFFSKSGNTNELLTMINNIKHIDCDKIGVFCERNSKMKNLCDYVIEIPFLKEINGYDILSRNDNIDMIPTNSVMSNIFFCNIIVSILKRDISLYEYKNNHRYGNIGYCLLRVRDIIIHNFPKILVNKDTILLHDILLEMTNKKIGLCCFVNDKDNLIGILSDGDIRRMLLNNKISNELNIDQINKQPYFISDLDMLVNDCNNKYLYIPIILENKLIGMIRSI